MRQASSVPAEGCRGARGAASVVPIVVVLLEFVRVRIGIWKAEISGATTAKIELILGCVVDQSVGLWAKSSTRLIRYEHEASSQIKYCSLWGYT